MYCLASLNTDYFFDKKFLTASITSEFKRVKMVFEKVVSVYAVINNCRSCKEKNIIL